MRNNCVRLHSAAAGTSQKPIRSRGSHLASANQLRNSSDQKFTGVDHLRNCPVRSKIKFSPADPSPPQKEPQFTCTPSTKACHRHTDNSAGKSTAEVPHEASMTLHKHSTGGWCGAESHFRRRIPLAPLTHLTKASLIACFRPPCMVSLQVVTLSDKSTLDGRQWLQL